MRQPIIAATLALAFSVACGSAEQAPAENPVVTPVDIGGQYQVTGVTIGRTSGTQRPVQGRVNLVVTGDRYTTHFELTTVFPSSDASPAEIVGTGEGTVDGPNLEGSAELQIVASTVPGIDVGFAFVPHSVSSKVRSSSRAEFFSDGSVRIEIENEAA